MNNPLLRASDVLDLKVKKSATLTIAPDASVFDAVQLMNEHKVGSVVVVKEGRVAGILTERDILVRIVAVELDPHTTLVAEAMTRDPFFVTRSTPASEAMSTATNKRCRHFPVVEAGKLLGLISIGDLMVLASREQADRINAGIPAMKAMTGR
ncbi:MAG: CBS domain-containing protein [Sedimenticolaceae bacterium]